MTLNTIFANVINITPLIQLLLSDEAPLYKYLHYTPLILPRGTYDSQLISARWLASINVLLTSCQQKRKFYNYLHVPTVAIVPFIAISVIVLFLAIYVVEHAATFTRIHLSVATIYGARVTAKYNSN